MPKISPDDAFPALLHLAHYFGLTSLEKNADDELIGSEDVDGEIAGSGSAVSESLGSGNSGGENTSGQGGKDTEPAAPPSAHMKRLAGRFILQELAERHPGKSVEVRVPFVGAVQIIAGLNHRRGTPPNVVEIDADTFLQLALGAMRWEEAMIAGKINASGSLADISEFFPLFNRAFLARIKG